VQVNFCLGFLACFLVVMVVAFMVTILANAPVPTCFFFFSTLVSCGAAV
jgi:hypothetical protein